MDECQRRDHFVHEGVKGGTVLCAANAVGMKEGPFCTL